MRNNHPSLTHAAANALLFYGSVHSIVRWLNNGNSTWEQSSINAGIMLFGAWLSLSHDTLQHTRYHNLGNSTHKQRQRISSAILTSLTVLNLLLYFSKNPSEKELHENFHPSHCFLDTPSCCTEPATCSPLFFTNRESVRSIDYTSAHAAFNAISYITVIAVIAWKIVNARPTPPRAQPQGHHAIHQQAAARLHDEVRPEQLAAPAA